MGMNVEWLLLALAPVFLLCVAWEAWWCQRRELAYYGLRDTLCNAALALLHQGADKLAWVFVLPVYAWVYQHHRLLELAPGWASFLLLFLAQDFLYYWFHRASHRVRWLWAAHSVHHSSTRMNFSTAFRQSLMYPVAGMWLFWLPLAWLGFPPQQVVGVVLLNLAFQFFVHTQTVPRLGWLEKVFNTPSIHRAHHACNPCYIDRNYAGVLVIWDRLFGTYVDECDSEPCRYGTVTPVNSYNPLIVTFHAWRALLQDLIRARRLGEAVQVLFGPPEATERRPPAPVRDRP